MSARETAHDKGTQAWQRCNTVDCDGDERGMTYAPSSDKRPL